MVAEQLITASFGVYSYSLCGQIRDAPLSIQKQILHLRQLESIARLIIPKSYITKRLGGFGVKRLSMQSRGAAAATRHECGVPEQERYSQISEGSCCCMNGKRSLLSFSVLKEKRPC